MKRIYGLFAIGLLLAMVGFAQQGSTGSVSGVVADPSGNVVPNAAVKLISELNGETRTGMTNEAGEFFFGAVTPGAYTVRIEVTGFRPFEEKGNIVPAAGRLAVPKIQLQVGSVSESIQVTAQAAAVATTTTAVATTIDSKQMDLVAVKGRDPMSIFKTLPGVQIIPDQDTWGGSFQSTVPVFQGRGGNTVYTDGVNGGDGGGGGNFSGITSIDAIAEVNVQANSYTAEYGFKGGAQVNMVTKHGGNSFHGSAAYYKRHEQFNAQNFFNNKSGTAKPRYRYDDWSGTLGGPVPVKIPVLNPDKKRFNFFYSVEDMRLKDVNALRFYSMPTALERAGDFSQTFTGGNPKNALVTVKDPLTGVAFPGNVIPANRVNPIGQALLNFFPLPNTPTIGYNFTTQESSIDHPRRAQLMRYDLRPTDTDTISIKYQNWFTKSVGWEVAGRSAPWGLVRQRYDFTADQGKVDYTKIITPHLVNEASIGVFYSTEVGPPEDQLALASIQKAYDRNAALGSCAPPLACPANGTLKPGGALSTIKQIAPGNNPLGLIPQVTWGSSLQNNSPSGLGQSDVPQIAYDGRWPIDGADTSFPIADNLTYTRREHTFKAGITRIYERFGQARSSTFAGKFDFSNDSADPSGTGFAYANAFIGHVTNYTESMGRVGDNRREYSWAWYVQDTWRARRNLTIDYGLRMYKWGPALQGGGEASAFSFARFDPKWGGKPPVFYQPTLANGARRALNPLTGEVLPVSYIGLMVPGTGYTCGPITPKTPCLINGIVLQEDPTYTDVGKGFNNDIAIQFDPRFGIAWDPLGNAKMVIRTSFGTFHDVTGGNSPNVQGGGPSYNFTQTIRYTDLNSYFLGVGPTSVGNASGFRREGWKLPVTYNYTFGIQREIGFNTVFDVAYVGSNTHHMTQSYDYNALPAGVRFLPQSHDASLGAIPAATAASPGALPDNFLRPIIGFGSVTVSMPAVTARYDSLQISANHRFSHGIQFTGAYTWAGGTNKAWFQNNPLPSSVAKQRNTNVQKEALVFTYTIDIPKGSRLVPGAVSRQVLDGWQFQGVSIFATGLVSNISGGTTDNFDFTGGGESCGTFVQTGNAVLARDQRTVDHWFDTSVFKRPIGRGDIGNNCNNAKFILPGFNNHDLSVFKNFRIAEGKTLIFKAESFNALNHTQFSTVGTTASFNPAGAQTNSTFGAVTAARDGRKMMFSLKFQF
jgi:hypothetical protein